MDKSNFLADQVRNHLFRTGTFAKPTVMAVGLLEARIWQGATAYALNSYIVSVADVPSGAAARIYRATSVTGTGTSSGTEPTWPVTDGGTVTDNAGANQIVWTEQTPTMKAGTLPEVASANAYARQDLPPLDANWTGAATGAADNTPAVQFPVATGDYGIDANSRVVGMFLVGSTTFAANAALYYIGVSALADRKDVNINDQLQFAAGNIDIVES